MTIISHHDDSHKHDDYDENADQDYHVYHDDLGIHDEHDQEHIDINHRETIAVAVVVVDDDDHHHHHHQCCLLRSVRSDFPSTFL